MSDTEPERRDEPLEPWQTDPDAWKSPEQREAEADEAAALAWRARGEEVAKEGARGGELLQ
jgi:hypothetical protein